MAPTLRILFIEDNESDAILIEAHLRRAGYAVVARRLETQAELAPALAAGEWDLVLCDYSLPQFSPLQALQALAASGRDLPFIIVSGAIQEEQAVAALRAGAHDFVVKDRLARLVPAIERELREAEERRQRRRAVLALQGHQARFKALIENSSDAISLLGPDGRLQYLSPSTERILGYAADEVLGADPTAYIHPDDLPAVLRLLADLVRKPGQTSVAQYRFRHKDGSWRWLEASINNLLAEPNVGAIVFNYRDITERLRAEAAQKQSETLFRSLFELMPDAVVLIDPHTQRGDWPIVDCNFAACRMNGYERHELIGQSVDVLNLTPGTPAERQAYLQELRQADTRNLETYHRRKNGEVFPVEVSTSIIRIGNRELIIGIDRDITGRKDAEADLAQTIALLSKAEQVGHLGSWEWNSVTDKSVWSDGLYDILGISRAESPPAYDAYLALVLPEDRDRARQAIDDAFYNRHPLNLEARIRRPDGQVRVIASRANIVFDEGGQPARQVGIDMDITDSVRAREALAASEAQLRALFTAMTDVVLVFDAEGRYLQVPATNARLVRPASEMLGRTVHEVLPPADAAQIHDAILRTLRAQQRLDFEYSITIDDEPVWFEASISPLERDTVIWISRDITARKQAEAEVQRQVARQIAQSDIDNAILGSLDIKVTLHAFLNTVTEQLGVDAADVLLFDPHARTLSFAAGRGFRTHDFEKVNMRLTEGRAGQALLERRIISAELAEALPPTNRTRLLVREDFVSYLGVPLIAKGQPQGTLELFHRKPLQTNPEWLDFVESLASRAAIAIYDAGLFDSLQRSNAELQHAYDATIEGWSRALDLRDKETEGHSRRVTELTLRLATAMGTEEYQLEHIKRGAQLHDIGKMGVPDQILLKPGALTDAEWVIMRQHPTLAYQMLLPIQHLRQALPIPYCHHEKWDGTGYPRGLAGDAIPMAARIFAVVDVWDALRSERPYRPPWTAERTAEYIQAGSGRHFDPQVVEVFLKLVAVPSLMES